PCRRSPLTSSAVTRSGTAPAGGSGARSAPTSCRCPWRAWRGCAAVTAAVPEQEREHSPGGVPQPPADQAEQAPVVEVAHRQEPEEERRPEGVPAGQLAVGGLSAVALAVTGVWALVGVPGLLVAGGLAAGAGALYVRRRLGLGG